MTRPNVLVFYTDQQRWDALGAAGNPLVRTPNLDALAARGTVFANTFVNCPVCMPSRMSMLSGRYPAALRIASNGIEMPADIPCLQHMLSAYGYRTANIGKLHFTNHASYARDHREPHPLFGFHHMVHSDEPGCYDDAYLKWVQMHDPAAVDLCRVSTPPAWTGTPVEAEPRNTHEPYVFRGPEELSHSAFVADETIRFLRERGSGPFFCIAGFYAPHPPVNPPARFVRMYDQAQMPLPARNPGENFQDTSDEQWRKSRAYYYALVSHVDDQVGRVLAEVDRLGLRDNTIVIFTSDHGENLGDHGRVQKGQAWDSSARVPLIVSWPGSMATGLRQDGIVEAVDIAPTILDYAGVQQPPFVQGRSLRPALAVANGAGDADPAAGPKTAWPGRESAFIELRVPFGHSFKALRTLEHLYIVHGSGSEELFDLATDPHQLTNVISDPARRSTVSELRRQLLSRWFDAEGQYPKRTGDY